VAILDGYFITSPLFDKLCYKLLPKDLFYFHDFKEKIHITRQHALHTKAEADYRLLYRMDFHSNKTPLDKERHQGRYDIDSAECNEWYAKFCNCINALENHTNETFLRYYALGYTSNTNNSYTYNKSKQIYDHGLVHYCNGHIVEALKLAVDLIDLINKEGPNLKPFLSDARGYFFPEATFIEAMQYSKVIGFLSKSMEEDASKDSLYFHMAAAYLKSGNSTLDRSNDIKSEVRGGLKPVLDAVNDPVDIVSGAFFVDEVDLILQGPFPFKLRRNYNSQNPAPSLLGFGWKLSVNPYLIEKEDHFFAAEEDGTVIDYRFNPLHAKWEVFPEDNPSLTNHNAKGIGGTANPYHNYIEKNTEYLILHGSDGSQRRFEGKLLRQWSDGKGNSLNFIFDQDKLVRIENSLGGYLGFSYHPAGNISAVDAHDGRRVTYDYDFDGDLISVELPDAALITYEYDLHHQIILQTKPHGLFVKNTYDEGRVIKQQSPSAARQQPVATTTFTYRDGIHTVTDPAKGCTEYKIYQGNIYQITDPKGNQILQSYFIDANSWFDAETEQVKPWTGAGSYPKSLKSSRDKRGLLTEYRYDERGNPIQITIHGKDLTGNGDKQVTKNMTFDEHDRRFLEQILDRKTVTTYDPIHSYLPKRIEKYVGEKLIGWTELQYNDQGQVKYEDKSGAIIQWEYDDYGFPEKKICRTGTDDPDVTILFEYNLLGQCIVENFPDAIIKNDYDVLGNLKTYSIHDLSGELIFSKHCIYNKNNALTQQTSLDPYDLTEIDYNSAGLSKEKRQQLTKAIVDESKKIEIQKAGTAHTLYEYNVMGHLIEIVDSNGYSTYRDYDELGRVSKITRMDIETKFDYEPGGLLSETIFPNGGIVSLKYATNGLLIKEEYPEETEFVYKYDLFGRPISVTKNGITVEMDYDDALQKITYKQQGIVIKIEEFDLKGNLVSITDAEGYVWKKNYDDLGRLKSATDPEGNQTVWQYQGNTIKRTLSSKEVNIQRYQAGNLVESQTFDPEGNLIARILSEYSQPTNSYKETQGEFCTTTWMNTQGYPLAVEQADIVTIHHYDPMGQCLATVDGEGRCLQRKFDPFGNLAQKTLGDGTVITYEYDAGSNLTLCTLPQGVLWKATYDLAGKKRTEELHAQNDISQKWKYTYEKGRLIEALDPNQLKHCYCYDDFGRKREEEVDGKKRLYTYDLRGLITSTEQFSNDHTKIERSYDKAGCLILEKIFLNDQLLQQTNQSWEPSKRHLQIKEHQRTFAYLGSYLSRITVNDIDLACLYDTDGSVMSHSTQDSNCTYQYHFSGLPKTVTTHAHKEPFREIMQWDKSGKMSSYQLTRNGIPTEKLFTYNLKGQLQSVNEEKYTFDFDHTGCGIRTESPSWKAEELDPFGKIISEISEGKKITTVYDDAGQVISRLSDHEQQTCKWDPWGNLTEVTTKAYTWKAIYDALSRRLQTVYTPLHAGYLFTTKGNPQVTTSYYDPENEFDEIGLNIDGNTFWKLIGNKNCETIIDNSGNSVDLAYDVLGKLIAVIDSKKIHWNEKLVTPYGPRGPPESLEPNLLSAAFAHAWQGKRIDPTGFIWMGARYYAPVGGRFLSTDPIGIPISLDLYNYANGDPVNFNDPNGRFHSIVYGTIPPSSILLDKLPYHPFDDGSIMDMMGRRELSPFDGIKLWGRIESTYESIVNFLSEPLCPAVVGGNFPFPGGTPRITKSFIPNGVQTYTRSNLQLGQQMHKSYKQGLPGLKEYRLPSGKRIDFVDPINGEIFELKPNNPRSIKLGEKQLELYKKELMTVPEFKNTDWKTLLETY
jgi:RHS repeat-associated protein